MYLCTIYINQSDPTYSKSRTYADSSIQGHRPSTTGNRDFAVCHRYSAKTKKHSAIGKGFAECNTRQTAHGIYSVGKQLFAECFLSRTRQIVYRISNLTLGKKKWFAECFFKIHSAKDYCLSSVFGNYTRQTYFPKKKIIFFSAYLYGIGRLLHL